ncbi:hypothetical protein BJP36_43960 [Moorena producens JHB]|uniref:Uncharacterized protein n=1 Tax=Moorena producens (strain JHB) TaxID=1454205 RepID=A0A9Q9UVZ1_MOOP1|nr:hypothetical protein [Moorena producens]WAN69316.1 hypothetical protein BJP36_43960 [Moorena producens JHB]
MKEPRWVPEQAVIAIHGVPPQDLYTWDWDAKARESFGFISAI